MTPGLMLPRFSPLFGKRGMHQPVVDQCNKVLDAKAPGTECLRVRKEELLLILLITEEFSINNVEIL